MKTLLIILIFTSAACGIMMTCKHGKHSWKVSGHPTECDLYRAATCAKQNSKFYWPKCALAQDADIPKEFKNFCPHLIALTFLNCKVEAVSTPEAMTILGSGKILEEFDEDWLPRNLDLTAVGIFKGRKNLSERIDENLESLKTVYVNGKLCIHQISGDPMERIALREALEEKCPMGMKAEL